MFNDERINQESGKIYQRGILIATIIALVYGAVHAWYLSTQGELAVKYLFTELFIVVCGAVILFVGGLRFVKIQDERTVFEKHNYYLNAGKVFLIAALSGYALTIPFATYKNFADAPINRLIIILMTVSYIYFFYNFKRKDININYSFIDESKGKYYGRVWENIGKLALVLAFPFFFAAMIDFGIHQSFLSFWCILTGYASSVIGLGLEYLFISWVEKRNCDDDTDYLKKGTVALGVLGIFICILHFIFEGAYCYILDQGLVQISVPNIYKILSYITEVERSLGYLETALGAMWLSHIISQMNGAGATKKAVGGGLTVSAVSIVCSGIITYYLALSIDVAVTYALIRNILQIFNLLMFILTALFNVIFAVNAIKEVKISRWIVLMPILSILSFLASSVGNLFIGIIVANSIQLVNSVFALIVFKRHKFQ